MKTITLWKTEKVRFGRYNWSLEEVNDDWNGIYSEPYIVEVPDEFSVGCTVDGQKLFFKDGCNIGYTLTIFHGNKEGSAPYLIGGSPVESIRLKVIGPAERS